MQLQGHLFLRGSMSVIIGIWAEGREGVFKNSPLFLAQVSVSMKGGLSQTSNMGFGAVLSQGPRHDLACA